MVSSYADNLDEPVTRREFNRLRMKQEAASFWFAPNKSIEKADNGQPVLPQYIYWGGDANPTFEIPAVNMQEFNEAYKAIKEGKTNDIYKLAVDPFKDIFGIMAHERKDAVKKAIAAGSIGTNQDFKEVDSLTIFADVIGTGMREFVIQEAVRTLSVPSLQISFDSATRFKITKNVGEGQDIGEKKGTMKRVSYTLPKHAVSLAFTDEAQIRASRDVFRIYQDMAIQEFLAALSADIATEMATSTNTVAAGATFVTYAAGQNYSQVIAHDKIGEVMDSAISNNGRVLNGIMHSKGYRGYLANTHTPRDNPQGIMRSGELSGAMVIRPLNGLALTGYVDNEHIATEMTLLNPNAFFFMEGLTKQESGRLQKRGIDFFVMRRWQLPKIVDSTQVWRLTGIR